MPIPQLSLFFFTADSTSQEPHKYQMLLDSARFADQHGFTAIWTPERHFQPFGGLYPSPAVTSAALAVLTRRIAIRAGSVVMPLQDPLRVAEEWSMIDNLSNGRTAIAFASGWHVNDFVLAPGAYARKYERMYEGIATVQRLWRGASIGLPNGTGVEVETRILPRPIQPELPIWLTASGRTDQTFVRAGQLGFNVLTANFMIPSQDDLVQRIARYRDTIAQCHGRRGHVTFMAHTFVAETERDVQDVAGAAMKRFLAVNLDLQRAQDGGAQTPRGYESMSPRQAQMSIELKTRANLHGPLSFIGTVDQCVRRAESFHDAGVDEIACLIDFGIPLPHVMASLARLATLIGHDRPSAVAAG